jgi:predicted transcriptional regulator
LYYDVGWLTSHDMGDLMSKETVSFRIEVEKRAALDEVAEILDRDRSAVINEAIDAYLELHHWQIEHIKQGLADAENGTEGIPHEEVFERLRGKIEERLGPGDR